MNSMDARQEHAFKALADPTRREMLRRLRQGPLTAGQLGEGFGVSKASLSHHFNVLKTADLVRSERDGQHRVYSLNTSVFEQVAGILFDLFDRPKRKQA